MPLYRYTAVDDLGHEIRGQAEAATESALEALLRGQGRWLAEARERGAAAKVLFRPLSARAIPRRVLIEFFLATSLQLKSGVALVDALAFAVQNQTHAGFRTVQRDLLNRVKSGASFSEALLAHSRTFTPLVISLVRAGESSGRLAEACSDIRRNYEWLDRLIADIRQALLYPAFVLTATLLFLFLVFTYLMPRFAAVLVEIKVPMPWLTQVFLDTSAFMTAHGWAVAGGLVLTVLGFKLAPQWSPAIARAFDGVKLSVPVFGPLHHLICLSR